MARRVLTPALRATLPPGWEIAFVGRKPDDYIVFRPGYDGYYLAGHPGRWVVVRPEGDRLFEDERGVFARTDPAIACAVRYDSQRAHPATTPGGCSAG